MKTRKIENQTSFGILYPIPKKAYEIGGKVFKEFELTLKKAGENLDVEVIPKKGLLTGIEGFIFHVKEIGAKDGRWSTISKDPNGYFDGMDRAVVKNFSLDNLTDSLRTAISSNKHFEPYKNSRLHASPSPDWMFVINPKVTIKRAVNALKNIFKGKN